MAPRFARAQQVTVDDKHDQIEALKIELEEAKEARDKVIAMRWDNKQRDAGYPRPFAARNSTISRPGSTPRREVADRLQAQIQNDLRDAEEAEAQAEAEKAQFLSLGSALRDQAHALSRTRWASPFPPRFHSASQGLNAVLKSAEIKRDAPDRVLNDLMNFERSELALTRGSPCNIRVFCAPIKCRAKAWCCVLGFVTEAYRDDKSGQVGAAAQKPAGQFPSRLSTGARICPSTRRAVFPTP